MILTDGAWRIIDEARLLSDLSYDRLIEDGLDIQAHPVPQSAWNDPALHPNPALVRAMRRDARLIEGLCDGTLAQPKALAEARILLAAGRPNGSISRAYYAAFTAVR